MAGSTSTFLLSAADISWGRRERTCITALADSGGSLDATYFEIDTLDSAGADVLNYVWFDVDGVSIDPAPAGRTGIEVDIATGDTAAVVALALQTALEAEANYRAKIDSSNSALVIIDSEFVGEVAAAAADVDTLFAFEQNVVGVGGDLGKSNGGVEVSISTNTSTITSDQTGGGDGLILDEVQLGVQVEVTMTLIEMTAARWKAVVGSVTGDNYTPSGGTELTGFGESRLYASYFELGGELVLHPTRLAAADNSRNISLWKSAPKPGSINFSPDDVQGMEITFTALADREVAEAIRLMAFGDNTQDVRA
jgi:hypothetical protein